ncbi:phosphoribosylaminoimidazolecarboxamide formyltransferase [Archaeoglobus sp.]
MKVLISSSIKEGIETPARQFSEMGYEILATDGTAQYLASKGLKAKRLSEITGIAESSTIKTLHPKVYEMIFSGEIKAVVVIPYNFRENPCRENIDIGGISLLRAAAKAGIPAAYDLDSFKELVKILKGEKRYTAARVFRFTSEYDKMIAEWLENEAP